MEANYYLYLTYEDSRNVHPDNTNIDFTIELPRTLYLDGEWDCCLKDVTFSSPNPNIVYVCSDLCVESFACDTSYPILRVVPSIEPNSISLTFSDSYYIRVHKRSLGLIRIFIRGDKLLTTKTGIAYCTILTRTESEQKVSH
jgi:hypothetical protein